LLKLAKWVWMKWNCILVASIMDSKYKRNGGSRKYRALRKGCMSGNQTRNSFTHLIYFGWRPNLILAALLAFPNWYDSTRMAFVSCRIERVLHQINLSISNP
jgi:hypothetical protein